VMRDGEWDARIMPLYRAALRSEAPGQAWRAFLDALDEFETAAASLWADPEGPTAADMERLSQSRERVIECARALAGIRSEADAARTIAGGGRTGERSRRWTCSRTMERPVHNHDPEQGPGLACRESLIGDCIRAEYAHLTRELDAARAENQRLREALERVAENGCERFHGADCWQMGMDPHAEDYADRVCDPCFARRALAKDMEVSNGA